MTDISQRYDRVATAFAGLVARVPNDAWENPSPCEGWTARDVVRHVIDSHATFVGFIDRTLPDAPTVEDDPVEAFDTARRTVLALVQDPSTATQTYTGHFGERSFEWRVDRFLSFDLVVHGWDLARATGQDESMDPRELARIRADAEALGEMARAPGVFAPPVQPPEDADEQTRVLAFLGRQV